MADTHLKWMVKNWKKYLTILILNVLAILALQMLNKIGIIAAIALLVFGHGLNMVLNLLSVIVHGVRLNTLEFSTHLGVSWSGKKYEPFSENK